MDECYCWSSDRRACISGGERANGGRGAEASVIGMNIVSCYVMLMSEGHLPKPSQEPHMFIVATLFNHGSVLEQPAHLHLHIGEKLKRFT